MTCNAALLHVFLCYGVWTFERLGVLFYLGKTCTSTWCLGPVASCLAKPSKSKYYLLYSCLLLDGLPIQQNSVDFRLGFVVSSFLACFTGNPSSDGDGFNKIRYQGIL